MNKAQTRTIMDETQHEAQNYKQTEKTSPAAEVLTDLETCPRSVDEVYSLGIKIQYYLGDIYLELDALQPGRAKTLYKEQAMRQLDIKNQIGQLAKDNLNKLLTYFYSNGGPIIEAPVSEQMAREKQPFFNRIATNSLNKIIVLMADAREGNPEDAVKTISSTIIDMYTAMSKLYRTETVVKEAFQELIALQMD